MDEFVGIFMLGVTMVAAVALVITVIAIFKYFFDDWR